MVRQIRCVDDTGFWPKSAVSGSVFRGEADSTSAPPASPCMSVQHLTTLWYPTTIYRLSLCCSRLPTLFFILIRKSTAVQYPRRNGIFQDLQTFNGETPQGTCTSSCMMLQRWRHLPNQLALWKPFLDLFICSVATKAPCMIYLNV